MAAYLKLILWLSAALWPAVAAAPELYYEIPNPFKTPSAGYYAIKSYQSVVSRDGSRKSLEVDDYFSLKLAISYSLHKDRDQPDQPGYAIIGDGARGRTYIVRRPDQKGDRIDCELDQHHHQHTLVFPWQYQYDQSPDDEESGGRRRTRNNGGKRRRRSDKWSKKRFVYGVGAILLNAVARKIVSQQVGDNSPYPSANLWRMNEGDLEVKLAFDKPDEHDEHLSLAEQIARTHLGSVQLTRAHVVKPNSEIGGTSLIDRQTEHIFVKYFISDFQDSELLLRIQKQLNKCRAQTRGQRLFPSLMRAISLSPDRMFNLDYLVHKYARLAEPSGPPGSYDEARHRHRWGEDEFHSEWFSFKRRAQVSIYESPAGLEVANASVADVFAKYFAAYPARAPHSTEHYQLVERDGRVERCLAGVPDSTTDPHGPLLRRLLHFAQEDRKQRDLVGVLTGLGALLLNAFEVPDKRLSLFSKTIDAVFDPLRPQERTQVQVDEWSFRNKKSGRSYHFYFAALDPNQQDDDQQQQQHHQLEQLIRVDVRDYLAAELGDAVPEGAQEMSEADLIVRYDITGFRTETDDDELAFIFDLRDECKDAERAQVEDSESEASSDELEADQIDYPNRRDPDGDDQSSEGDLEDQKQAQDDAEDFEFEPDQLAETAPLPDFYEFLAGAPAYEATTTIERLPDGLAKPARGQIYLHEQVDLAGNQAILGVSHESRERAREAPTLRFYINYNSDLVFKLDGAGCQLAEQVDDWLRLLSAEFTYFKLTSSNASNNHDSIESNRLRLYGVGALWKMASESESSWFLGAQPKVLSEPTSGRQYKLVDWRVSDESDTDMVLNFRFAWSLERQLQGRHLLPSERLKLNKIFVAHLLDSDDPDDSDSDLEYSPMDELPDTKFQRVALSEIELRPIEQTAPFQLPAECRPIIERLNQRNEAEAEAQHQPVPDFMEFIKQTNAYHAIYRIRHTSNSRLRDKSELLVSENYDRTLNRGSITIGQGDQLRELFIDGNQRAIYLFLPSSSTCKRIASLKRLVELADVPAYDDNPNFDPNKLWGLAAVWIWLSSFKEAHHRLVHRYDASGNRQSVYTYRVSRSMSAGSGSSQFFSVEMSFVSRPQSDGNLWHLAAPKTKLDEPKLQLSSIAVLSHDAINGRLQAIHHTLLQVDEWSLYAPSGWNLPRECDHLAPPDPEEPTNPADPKQQQQQQDAKQNLQLPSLTSILQATNKFYLRSEMSISYPESQREQAMLIMFDEWLYHADLRIQTPGGLDLIVYGPTREYFDVSELYLCSSRRPRFDQHSTEELKLAELWDPQVNLTELRDLDDLSALLYSPLSLWRLAELLPKQQVVLFNTLDIIASGKQVAGGERRLEALEREMRLDVWRVSSAEGARRRWSYDLHFEKMSQLGPSGLREWYVLDKVEIHDLASAERSQPERLITFQVANYRYELDNQLLMDMLLLPEGAGCRRHGRAADELWKQNDEFVINLDQPYQLWYEASLELVDEQQPARSKQPGGGQLRRKVLPTLLGRYVSSGPASDGFALEAGVHYARVRHQDGRVESTKTTMDKATSMVYQVDRLTGNCRIGQQRDSAWQLEFPTSANKSEIVTLDRDLFSALFLATAEHQFQPINRYSRHGFYINTYEHNFDQLKVVENSVGRANVLRRFQYPVVEHKPRVSDDGVSTMMHHSVSVDVTLFGTGHRPTRLLRLSLGFAPIGRLDVLRHTNLLQCFNDGSPTWDKRLRSFAVDYLVANRTDYLAAAEEQFLEKLLGRSKLSPLQLVGPAHFEFGPNHLLRAHFKLLEGLTAYEYFVKVYQARMSDQMELLAELKVVPKLDDCSRWCDQLACTAMSYCSDRTCRVASSNMLRERRDNGVLCPLDLELLSSSQPDDDCMYFYTLRPQPRTLDRFVHTMDTTINTLRPQFELQSLGLKIDQPELLLPVAFSEFLDDTESAQSGANLTQESPVDSLVLYRTGERLDLARLELAKLAGVTGESVHAQGQAECLERCLKAEADCQLASFCRSTGECVVVSGKLDLKTMADTFRDPQPACSLFAKDYRLGYTRFEDTRLPLGGRRLDGYSQLECASFCQLQVADEQSDTFNCLSFDHCAPKAAGQPVCFIQRDHLVMDSFDLSLLSPKYNDPSGSKQLLDGKEVACDHYSKSVLADYRRLAHKSFATGASRQPLISGPSLERCALDCEQDEQCLAFEYCFNDRQDPPKSCLYLKTADLEGRPLSSAKDIDRLLEPSDFCSVHILSHQTEEFLVEKNTRALVLFNPSKIIDAHKDQILGFAALLGLISASLLLAAAFQFVYIRFFGRPFIFEY